MLISRLRRRFARWLAYKRVTHLLQYNSTTGEIDLDGHFEGIGYSGFGAGKNNPAMEADVGIGPIPRGRYKMTVCDPDEHPNLASPVFRLMPVGHNAHNRTGFLLHGDNLTHTASHGCIIAGRSIRERIEDDRETDLEVV